MMNILHLFYFIVVTVSFTVECGTISLKSKGNQYLTLNGRVIFSSNTSTRIDSAARLTVKLQDTSLADAPAKLIAQTTSKAVRFPLSFTIKYSPSKILGGHTYSLSATIRNRNEDLLYINDVHIRIIPTGVNRTKHVDVPVIRVKLASNTTKGKQRWPELLGKTGEEAVKVIKKETGFTQVMIVKEGSAVTLDYRTDRVRVFVNKKGIVIRVPTVG